MTAKTLNFDGLALGCQHFNSLQKIENFDRLSTDESECHSLRGSSGATLEIMIGLTVMLVMDCTKSAARATFMKPSQLFRTECMCVNVC